MISYKPLEKTLIDREIYKSKMCADLHISPNTQAKFKKGDPVSLAVIEKICKYLKCNVEDVLEIKSD